MAEPKIIYEDKNFLAINKPAGLLVHKTAVSKEPTLTDWVIKKYPEIITVGDPSAQSGQINLRPGVVHRLDKDTSGVILIARNQKYFHYLKGLFQNHEIKKMYLALTKGKIKSEKGIIEKPIGIKPGTTKRTVFGGKMAKEAVTAYEVAGRYEYPKTKEIFSLISASPKTGRTHQIRIHMSSLGHPLVGDPLYGKKKNPFGLERQFLHAKSLEFKSDGQKTLKIEAEIPEDLKNILNKLKPLNSGD